MQYISCTCKQDQVGFKRLTYTDTKDEFKTSRTLKKIQEPASLAPLLIQKMICKTLFRLCWWVRKGQNRSLLHTDWERHNRGSLLAYLGTKGLAPKSLNKLCTRMLVYLSHWTQLSHYMLKKLGRMQSYHKLVSTIWNATLHSCSN